MMRAAWSYLRTDLRKRVTVVVVLVLVLGLALGASLTALAGARRSASAYPRLLSTHDSTDVSTGGLPQDHPDMNKALSATEALPQVAESARVRIVVGGARIHGVLRTFPEFFGMVPVSGTLLTHLDRAKVISGRLANQSASDEAVVTFTTADKLGIRLGDRISLILGDPSDPKAEQVAVRVVGIVAVPGLFQGVSAAAPSPIILTRAFVARYNDRLLPPDSGDTYFTLIRLKRGSADIDAFQKAVEKSPYPFDLQFKATHAADVQKALHPYSVALWLLGAVGLFIVFIVGCPLLARHVTEGSGDYPVLRSLGLGRRELATVGVLRVAIITLLAVPVAMVTAFLLSPLTPIGDARIAEPAPGFAFDGRVLGLGVAGFVLLFLAVAIVPAFRAAVSARATDLPAGFRRPSAVASVAASVSASAPAVTGLRMALEPGHGRAAVPVRTTIASVVIALAALCTTVVFSQSMHRLIDDPTLSGFTYDALVIPQDESSPQARTFGTDVVGKSDLIAAYTNGNIGDAMVGGRDIFVWAITPRNGIDFVPISGRAPTDAMPGNAHEIVVGPTTLKRAHWKIGQTVTFDLLLDNQRNQSMKAIIVGSSAMPSLPFRQDEPGDGVEMTLASYQRAAPDALAGEPCCFVRFKPRVDPQAARTRLESQGMQVFLRPSRADLGTLARLTRMPTTLAYIILATAGVILIYALLTAISRRRRDLAILKVFGFVRAQVRRTVAWQASALAVIAAGLSIPIGLIVGRFAWREFAGQFGVVPDPTDPLYFMVIIVPLVLVLANLIALVPARAAARTKPALVLRAE